MCGYFFKKIKKNGGGRGKQMCDPLKQRRSKQLHMYCMFGNRVMRIMETKTK